MEHFIYIKRWNKNFIYDKILPIWLRTAIRITIPILDIWWKILLIIERKRKKWIKKKYYIAICTIFKDEAMTIKEWIEYHKLIGVDHIYLYNNQSTDNYLDIITPYIKDNFITLVNWNYPPPAQVSAYQHFRDSFWDETNWITFIDIDEYLCPKRVLNLKDWLTKYENFPSLTIYWKMFGSSGILDFNTNKLLTEQFFIAWDKFCEIGKPIFNTRFNAIKSNIKYIHELPAVFTMGNMKFKIPPINEFKYFCSFRCNRLGIRKNKDDITLQINHYATKSYNDFFVTRKKRGDVNNFANNSSVWSYVYIQQFSIQADYTIFRFIPFLKVRLSENKIENFFD